jgi:hypothetical protein
MCVKRQRERRAVEDKSQRRGKPDDDMPACGLRQRSRRVGRSAGCSQPCCSVVSSDLAASAWASIDSGNPVGHVHHGMDGYRPGHSVPCGAAA